MNVCCISDGDHFAQEQWVDSTTKTSLMLCSQKIHFESVLTNLYICSTSFVSKIREKSGIFSLWKVVIIGDVSAVAVVWIQRDGL